MRTPTGAKLDSGSGTIATGTDPSPQHALAAAADDDLLGDRDRIARGGLEVEYIRTAAHGHDASGRRVTLDGPAREPVPEAGVDELSAGRRRLRGCTEGEAARRTDGEAGQASA
ncbi:hypothetical protein GCM10023160_28760 [Brachybacterium paraconglomeratum]